MRFLTAKDIHEIAFNTNKDGNYYDANQVDDLLDDVERTLSHYEHPANTQRITDQLADAIAVKVAQRLEAVNEA